MLTPKNTHSPCLPFFARHVTRAFTPTLVLGLLTFGTACTDSPTSDTNQSDLTTEPSVQTETLNAQSGDQTKEQAKNPAEKTATQTPTQEPSSPVNSSHNHTDIDNARPLQSEGNTVSDSPSTTQDRAATTTPSTALADTANNQASERIATLDALVDDLDFTTARTRAAEWAAASDDPDLRKLLDERTRLYSSYVQQEHKVRSNLALLSGNRLQRQSAMVELLRGGPLIEMMMTAVVQPNTTVTDDDSAIAVTVIELAQAMDMDVYAAALERHQESASGELRDGINDYLIAAVSDNPQRYAKPLWEMVTTADPSTVSNLLPTIGNLLAQPDLFPEDAQTQFRLLVLSAAEKLAPEQSAARGALFRTALKLGDDEFTAKVMEALGPGTTDMAGLPPGWSSSDIGHVKSAGSVDFVEGAFVIRGAGENFWGESDGGHMAWRKVHGDIRFRAKLQRIDEAHKFTKAGISFRRNLDAGSPHASVLASPGDEEGYRFVLGSRSDTDGSSDNDGTNYRSLPQWMQLRREGQEVIAEISADGKDWKELARQSIDLGDEFYIGLVVSARKTGELAEAAIEVPLDDLF